MPTIFSHALFAVVIGKANLSKPITIWFWILTALCAIIPDADIISYSFGAERGSAFSHRGFTHSIAFALFFGAFTAFIVRSFLPTGLSFAKLLIFFSLAVFSHPVLDMLTDGGSGVALLSPFSNERFFFPWRPVEVSPIGLRFFSDRGLTVIFSEIIWVWLPAVGILISAKFIQKLKSKHSEV